MFLPLCSACRALRHCLRLMTSLAALSMMKLSAMKALISILTGANGASKEWIVIGTRRNTSTGTPINRITSSKIATSLPTIHLSIGEVNSVMPVSLPLTGQTRTGFGQMKWEAMMVINIETHRLCGEILAFLISMVSTKE